jgi:hypothetical protein
MTYKIPNNDEEWEFVRICSYGLEFKHIISNTEYETTYLLDNIVEHCHPLELPGISIPHYLMHGIILLFLRDKVGFGRYIRHNNGIWEYAHDLSNGIYW